jgi:hypothetical protein
VEPLARESISYFLGRFPPVNFPLLDSDRLYQSTAIAKKIKAITTKIRAEVCSGIGKNGSRRLSANQTYKKV